MLKLPVTTLRKDVAIKTVNGQSVFDFREQVLTIFSHDAAGLLLREFFAEPVTNEVKGEISWYTQASGPAIPLRDLDPERRSDVMAMVARIDGHLKGAAESLVRSTPQLGWLRDATTAMLSAPHLEGSIFLVGAVPVLSQWGCTPFGADPSLYQIIVQDEARVLRKPAVAAAPLTVEESAPTGEPGVAHDAMQPVAGPPPKEDASGVEPAEVPEDVSDEMIEEPPLAEDVQVVEERPAFWWLSPLAILLWLLLLLLLLLGLFLNFTYSERSRLARIDGARLQIDQLWGMIEQRAQQCRAEQSVSDLDLLTPQTVQRDLQRNSVQIGQQLNVSLVWTAPVDLDLSVTQPDNIRIDYEHPRTSNGRLDIDANRKLPGHGCMISPGRTPVENISWDGAPKSGAYRIKVNLFDLCDRPFTETVQFKLVINRNGLPPQELRGQVSVSEPDYDHNLTLP